MCSADKTLPQPKAAAFKERVTVDHKQLVQGVEGRARHLTAVYSDASNHVETFGKVTESYDSKSELEFISWSKSTEEILPHE